MLNSITLQLKAMQSIVEYEDQDEQCSSYPADGSTPDGGDLLLGMNTAASTEGLQPTPMQIFKLWQVYIERVNPLFKVIHVPTTQPHVVELATNPQSVPIKIQALIFSIFAMSVVALNDEECEQVLGQTRDDALQKFSKGVKTSLVKVKFLDSFDMSTVQALVIYLVCLDQKLELVIFTNSVIVFRYRPAKHDTTLYMDLTRHCGAYGAKTWLPQRRGTIRTPSLRDRDATAYLVADHGARYEARHAFGAQPSTRSRDMGY